MKKNNKNETFINDKILFVTHSSNLIYGAAKSLKYVLQNSEMDFDIVFNKKLRHGNLYDDETIKEYCGSRLNKSYSMVLPFSKNVCDCGETSFFNKIADSMVYIYGMIWTKFKLKRLIKKNNYKIVYLNSMVLYNLIDDKSNYILHVREIFSGTLRKYNQIVRKMSLCKGIIFIDSSTEAFFKKENINKTILNNPFDMSIIRKVNVCDYNKFKINTDKVNILMAGVLSDIKGTKFIVKVFEELNDEKYQLILVGKGNEKYVSNIKEITQNNRNIIFVPEQNDLIDLLLISDYVIRGESFFCIGRTIYEALYSGIGVIIPGDNEDMKNISDSELFKDKIHFYEPGNSKALLKVLKKLEKNVYDENHKDGNLDEYIRLFFDFIENSI